MSSALDNQAFGPDAAQRAPVRVPPDILAGLEAVRRDARVNKVDPMSSTIFGPVFRMMPPLIVIEMVDSPCGQEGGRPGAAALARAAAPGLPPKKCASTHWPANRNTAPSDGDSQAPDAAARCYRS